MEYRPVVSGLQGRAGQVGTWGRLKHCFYWKAWEVAADGAAIM